MLITLPPTVPIKNFMQWVSEHLLPRPTPLDFGQNYLSATKINVFLNGY